MFKNETLHDKRGYFNFPIVNFPVICSNIPAASACREAFEDAKHCCQREVIKICISKKNRQHNGQKKKYKRTNDDLQNIHIKLKTE